jgi:hypothetical protein
MPRPAYRWNLGRRLIDRLEWPDLLKKEDHMTVLERNRETTRIGRQIFRPIAKVYIYCPPCVCLIQTALNLPQGAGMSRLLEFCIRIDDRLPSSCYHGSEALERLTSVDKNIKDIEAGKCVLKDFLPTEVDTIDCPWLEQRIFKLEQETPGPSLAENPSAVLTEMFAPDRKLRLAGVIFLSETECCSTMLADTFKISDPRKPREADIFEIRCVENSGARSTRWARDYVGAFAMKRPAENDHADAPPPKVRPAVPQLLPAA